MAKSASPFDGIAWVTGASTGIGRTTALKLARKGWRVAATARDAAKLDALVEEGGDGYGEIIAFPGDVTSREDMARIIETLEQDHGGIGLALLNAGIYNPVHGEKLTIDAFEASFSVNLTGTVNCLVPVIDAMKTRRRGQIALVSSVAGYGGLPTSAAYGATKAGLINMAESLKFDLDKMGILIQVINPGFVDTPATASNPFPMPFLMDVDKAADRIMAGLDKNQFEITFPKRFTYGLKAINLLPYFLYFPFVNSFTNWKKRPLELPDLAEDQKRQWSD
ncbi:MAG: SDR family NAD(P)-dependent oxidoreductase [Pseudomonadota bacterium]